MAINGLKKKTSNKNLRLIAEELNLLMMIDYTFLNQFLMIKLNTFQ